MRFEIRPNPVLPYGRLTYSASECTFEYGILRGARTYHRSLILARSGSSLLIDLLELPLADDGRLLYAMGYSNHQCWMPTSSSPPRFRQAAVVALLEEELVPGVSIRPDGSGDWPSFVNYAQGWVCLGQPETHGPTTAVEFASSTVAVLQDATLVALWLHPVGLPQP